jgi:hypothetical protein
MATVTVDQAKLVLNAFAAIFQNNLVSKDLVTWRKFDGEMNDRNGLTVVEQVTPDYSTTFTTNGVADLSSGVQDTTFGSEQYKLDQTVNSSMGWGDFVKIRDIGAARESEALKAAALRLATDIDAYVLGFAAKASNNWLGDGDTAVSTWDHLASGYTRLKAEGVDDDVTAVLSYDDWQALGNDVLSDNASLTDLGEGMYRQGFTGRVAGIPTLFTQQLPELTVGTRVASATSVTNYLSGDFDNNYEDVCISSAPGYFMTGLINFDGQTGAVTLKDGETFTIAGVYAYDNRAKKQLSHLQEFRVIGDFTASSGAFSNVRYYPAVITTGPHKNVVNTNGGGSTWDGLAITHKGTASATLHPRFMANKKAIIVNTADLITPATGEAMRKSLTKIPLSVRMWKHSDFATGAHSIRFDVALKANVAAGGRRRLVRINGS